VQANILVSTQGMSRERWLEARKAGIGGSEISAIMNRNPWESPLSIYLQKQGLAPEKEQNEAMYFGTLFEPLVADEFARRSGMRIKQVDRILQHPTYDFMIANIDRLIMDDDIGDGILECKNVNGFKTSEWKDGCPEHYRMQLQWYLGITGLEHGYIATILGGQKFIYHYIPRDEALIEQMFEAATDFWFNHVEPMIPPPVTEKDADTLSGLYPEHEDGTILNLIEADEWLIAGLRVSRKALKEAQDWEKLSCNRIKERMGTSEKLLLNGEMIATWKTNVKGIRMFKMMEGGE
jgi:putative phage-type endonuclease